MGKNKMNKKKKFQLSKLIIPFVILSIFAFTGIAIWLQFSMQMELSSTLITCFFGFMGGELWMLASIKKAKIYTDIDGDGIPDDEDDYIDPKYYNERYQQGVNDAINKVREELFNDNNKGGGIG